MQYPFRKARKWARITSRVGPRRALFAYLREGLALPSSLDDRFDDLAQRIADAGVGIRGEVVSRFESDRSELLALSEQVHALVAAAEHRDTSIRVLESRVREERERAEVVRRIAATTRWVSSAVLQAEPLVSVVLPTRNRPERLVTAVASVLAQTYRNWELVIVDDARSGEARVDPARFEDPRIRVLIASGSRDAGARNTALREIRGSLVAYLDDDNRMEPEWLKAVAWCFEENPEVDFVYGARIVDRPDYDAQSPIEPTLHFDPFDRVKLLFANYIDTGAIAHRAGLPEARWDESLEGCTDWDLALRLTREKPAYPLPVVSGAYTTDAPARVSSRERPLDAVAEIRRRHAETRVLVYTSMFPLVSETYIEEEAESLADHGARIAYFRRHRGAAYARVDAPVYEDLDRAIEEFRPTVLLVYWATFALTELPVLERLGLPFMLRVHSFDSSPELVASLRSHPACAGSSSTPSTRPSYPDRSRSRRCSGASTGCQHPRRFATLS